MFSAFVHLVKSGGWSSIDPRCVCRNPKVSGYTQCGGHRIAVAARWRDDFPTFLTDMGERLLGTAVKQDNAHRQFGLNIYHLAMVPNRAERAAKSWPRRQAE
ncbi:hypothetical protein E2E30_13155 [Sphingomonas sp. AAP5]|uniref:hypothetical protein n=1 Tax=Sphingomonas sp. AAP5 TaxID=1523415 RepID=UPI00105758AD|nr:hypothetical protein [Sphingomonas sp. AAP5]QBM76612.1 hypothetical protein E2E30_13155 [Sphingomonas sp. AAP5]